MNKTALITGASSGIGKALAEIHAKHGGDLYLVARNKTELENIKQDFESKYGIKVNFLSKDLSLLNSAREVYDEVKNANIKIDYLINNAGFGLRGLFHELSLDIQLQMIKLNVVSLTELTYLFLNDFKKNNSGKVLSFSPPKGHYKQFITLLKPM